MHRTLLKKIIDEKWLTPRGVIGIWPANATDSDTVIVQPHKADAAPVNLEFLRQQSKKGSGPVQYFPGRFYCTGIETGKTDYIGAFTVTMQGIEKHIKRFMDDLDDYNKIILQALADRLAEAFAEMLHKKVVRNTGDMKKQNSLPTNNSSKKNIQAYALPRDILPARIIQKNINCSIYWEGERTTGITLTESLAMYPASSVCGWYFANPESKYFGIGKINKEQVDDYAPEKTDGYCGSGKMAAAGAGL